MTRPVRPATWLPTPAGHGGYRALATTYGLDILVSHLRTKTSTTPASSSQHVIPAMTRPRKTSIILTTRHVPGLLRRVGRIGGAGDQHDQDRAAARNRPWHYLFYVDFEGHEEDEAIQVAPAS
jgi:prephenate dehydratase